LPINLSIEGISRRSKFTQFLELFEPINTSAYVIFLSLINQYFKSKPESIIFVPRLTFGNQIIIQRKKWFVRKEYLIDLLKDNRTSLSQTYLVLNEWVNTHKIPTEVYIKIAETSLNDKKNDNYKPQYINFNSPIFMLLCLNIIDKAEAIIEISEMFPNSNQVNQGDGYVKEYIMNVN